jgi:hypothetical protein
MSDLLGVRYIGTKPQKNDNVLDSGAIWKPNEVINFNEWAALKLIVHKQVWEIANVDHNARTIVVADKKAKQDVRKHEPAMFSDVNSMDKEQLHKFARLNLLRQMPSDLSVDELRTQVKSLVTMQSIDDQLNIFESNQSGKFKLSIVVEEPEYEAYLHGILALKLVPVGGDESTLHDSDSSEVSQDGLTEDMTADTDNVDEIESSTITEEPEEAENEEAVPTLSELLEKMDKESMIALASNMKVKLTNELKKGDDESLRIFLFSNLPNSEEDGK